MDIKKVLTKPTKTISFTDMHMFGTRMTGLDSLTLESYRMILTGSQWPCRPLPATSG